jgi:hypothetical protein
MTRAHKTNLSIFSILVLSLCFLTAFMPAALAVGASNFRIEILAICGNNLKEWNEQCDGTDLASATCVGLGYASGDVTCNAGCGFNTSACVSGGAVGGGGGGGGGGGSSPYVAPVTSVIFNGRAYPRSTVTLLKDAQNIATTVADANASFSLNITGLTGGNYIFSLYSEDSKGNRSSLLTFPVGVTSGATTQISGIFITPTIAVDKSQVKRGDNIAIFGQSAPNSEITISVNSEEELFGKTKADAGGIYLYNFDTSPLAEEEHTTRSKAALNGDISAFSKSVSFIVGDKNVTEEKKLTPAAKSDVNKDGRVNLIDFSIVAYWNKRPSPPPTADLNLDGKVDLIDFSIMAFHWTG